MNREKISEVLQQFSIQAEEYNRALDYQEKNGGQIDAILISLGLLTQDDQASFLSKLSGLSVVNAVDLNSEFIDQFDSVIKKQLLKAQALPIKLAENTLTIACTTPFNLELNEYLQSCEFDVELCLISRDDFEYIEQNFSQTPVQESGLGIDDARILEMASEAPVVNLLNNLIARGIKQRASDLHLEPFGGKYRARYRIDGVLVDGENIPATMQWPLITRVKILSGMDIAEKRRPQDGKIETKVAGEVLDIRVSALPLSESESIVMRFLRQQSINYDMSVLGMSDDVASLVTQDIHKTAGVILMTGPTGSGKTTTLYTLLNELNTKETKIITLEDPVEYQLEGINQVQVNSDIGFDFAAGLRSIVRQDPDVIMLGEIRDKETAQIALQSALTGHLVFSTVHTNDAASAYTRLLDLGVEEFLLNAALISVVAQRLVRKLCTCAVEEHSHQEWMVKPALKFILDTTNMKSNFKKAVGCEKCNYTGYSGRVAITEYLGCDSQIQALPKNAEFVNKARVHNHDLGRRNLLEDGLFKVVQGVTTMEEVLRVAG